MVSSMAEYKEPEYSGGDASDQGAGSQQRNGSARRCIVSGELLAKEEMLRFVVGPGNEIVEIP